ncbi:MAG: hypothetical protein EBV06_16685 [Planctomycetia bacterium]|nr:hypothetical protein [Planctomycetia bacterium]
MILLIVMLVIVYVVLTLLLSAWTLWFSGYLYSEPTGQIEWRGPVAGVAVFGCVLLWVFLAYRSPDTYRSLWEFSSREVSTPFKELQVPNERGETERFVYIKGLRQYHLDGKQNLKQIPSRPTLMTVVEGDAKSVFKPERDEKGKLLIRKNQSMFASQQEPLRYLDENGRVMLEDSLGQITTFKTSNFTANIFLNVLMLGGWFAALWPLLRFQWSHALGQALVFWLVMMMFVMPPLLNYVESVAKERAKTATIVR